MDPKSVGKFIAFAEMTLTSIRDIAISLHHIRKTLENIEDFQKQIHEDYQ